MRRLFWTGQALQLTLVVLLLLMFFNNFEDAGVIVTLEEARKPMGMLKIDHIRTMLEMPRIKDGIVYMDNPLLKRMYMYFIIILKQN